MYSKFYSPNVIGVGSSKLDQSSYSHHADSDVGVAVIDRFTYYNLEFLETQVRDQSSKLTLGDLFDSYDEGEIHSTPGFRYDLFQGGEREARGRLVMDFFGNVQNVEGAARDAASERSWQDDLLALERMVQALQQANATGQPVRLREPGNDDAETITLATPGSFAAPSGFSVVETLQSQAVGMSIVAGGLAAWIVGVLLSSKS